MAAQYLGKRTLGPEDWGGGGGGGGGAMGGMTKFMAGPWGMAAQGGLGALGGIFAPDPYGGEAYDFALSPEQRGAKSQLFLGGLERYADPNQPIVSKANIRQMTAVPEARLEGTARAGRERIMERSIGRGQGSRGGMAEASLSAIDRALLDAKRQQGTEIAGQLAMQEPGVRMQASQAGLGYLGDQDRMALQDYFRMEQLRAGTAAFGSDLYRGVLGAASAFG